MSRRKHARRSAGGQDLAARAAALREALQAGGHRLDPDTVRRARELLAKVTERQQLSGGHTVVALAGATGSGKSSLFNALTRLDIATVGARRPTTAAPTACVWGAENATALLDWLDVPSQHRVSQESALDTGDEQLHGLVLLDLPDYDSTQVEHRVEVERLLELVDVFVWVVDPQKYADAALHRRYLAPLAGHDAVTAVVLNQADRLPPAALDTLARDLQRLVAADGLKGVQVLTTSAIEGTGVEDLRAVLRGAVQRRTAWSERLGADLDAVAAELREQVGAGEPALDSLLPGSGLVEALVLSSGVPVVIDAVERSYRRDALARAGWPFTRWVQRLRPDPLRRLRLRGSSAPSEPARDGRGNVGPASSLVRSSLPAATPAQLATVRVALRAVADRAADGLPPAWSDAARAAAEVPVEDVRDASDQAVVSTDIEDVRPTWWSVVGAVQLAVALATVLGLVWLVGLAVTSWLQLPEPPTPSWGRLPVPTLLLVGGVIIGLLLDLVVRVVARSRAARRAGRVGRRVSEAVRAVAEVRVVQPVGSVLRDHAGTRQALERLTR